MATAAPVTAPIIKARHGAGCSVPFVLAHLRVYKDAEMARSFLEPLGKSISANGLGTLGEIFDGDAPFPSRGCIAQAWTVGEMIRAWLATAG